MNVIIDLINTISISGWQWILTLFSVLSAVYIFLYTDKKAAKLEKQFAERELKIQRESERNDYDRNTNKKEAERLKHEREQLNIERKQLADEKQKWTIDSGIGEEY
ncbi:hypothetical protein [Photobacterium leiognathi]|uniref:hypothetical protein n=1 Tax=Photobacterium leiognathi TaxID=553611 RepID=UPI002738317B|nr:hypothetical protein [Photobacterium leiognathi]